MTARERWLSTCRTRDGIRGVGVGFGVVLDSGGAVADCGFGSGSQRRRGDVQ